MVIPSLGGFVSYVCFVYFGGSGDEVRRKDNHLEQREKLGFTPISKGRSKTQTVLPEPIDTYQKVEVGI